jgi:hypothetical protein
VPVTGRVPRVAVAGPGRLCFAPAAVISGGIRLLAFTVGAEADRAYGTRLHADGTAEPWYAGGRNLVRLTRVASGDVISPDAGTALPAPEGTTDMTGASLASDGGLLRAWYGARGRDRAWRIFHSASGDAGATWASPVAVLVPGPAGQPDCEHVLLPAVLRHGGGWLMWYAGRDGAHRRIHLASSADGLAWQRHGTVLGLGPDGSPDAYAADCPTVAAAPDGTFVMLYGAGTSRSVAAAVSRDGTRWQRLGPLVHRGEPGEPDSKYAFYPALLPAGPGTAELLYAGEDDQGRWRVLSAGALDLTALAGRRPPMTISPGVHAAVAAIRGGVPRKYLDEPGDCHDSGAPAWRSPEGTVTQLRPSSVPVFAVRGTRPAVIKLSRDRRLAEREADGAAVLHPRIRVPEMALHYDDAGRAAVVMQYLDGAPLSTLAASGDDRFLPVLDDVSARLAALTAATAVPATQAEAAQTLQAPEVTASWIGDIAAALAPWDGSQLRLNGRPLGLTPAQVTSTALRLAAQPPTMLALSSGDVHLGNIIVAPGSKLWHLIDLEFAGLHDPDRAAAGFLASVLKHAGLITAATADAAGGEIRVTTELRSEACGRLLDTPLLLGRLGAGTCDPARVFAFMVASLRFRFAAGPPGVLPPAPALAMLALAARMTAQDRP